jgi:hypothetical protein
VIEKWLLRLPAREAHVKYEENKNEVYDIIKHLDPSTSA